MAVTSLLAITDQMEILIIRIRIKTSPEVPNRVTIVNQTIHARTEEEMIHSNRDQVVIRDPIMVGEEVKAWVAAASKLIRPWDVVQVAVRIRIGAVLSQHVVIVVIRALDVLKEMVVVKENDNTIIKRK